MTIGSSEYFNFNGVDSRDMGVIKANFNTGLVSESFTPNRKILETKPRGSDISHLQGFTYDDLEIPVELVFEKGFNAEKLGLLADWLTTDYYAPLIFGDKDTHIYYATLISEGVLNHNCLEQGYVSVKFKCDSPFAWTPVYSHSYDLSINDNEGTHIQFNNIGHRISKPYFHIEVVSGDSFEIINNSNGGESFGLENLSVGEKLVIDCQIGRIETNQIGITRYKDKIENCKYISLVAGINHLNIKGNTKLEIKYQSSYRG